MTVISGQRQTENIGSVQRAIAIDKEIVKLDPVATPFTVITSRLNKRPVGDPEFSWVESEKAARFDAINHSSGYPTTTTEELVVVTEEIYFLNQLVAVPRTGEILRVKEKKGSSTVKFERGAAGTTAAALNEHEPLFIIARVAEEGALSFEGVSANPTKISNNTQIFRTSIEESGTAGSSENQTSPHDWVFQHQEAMREHMISIETAALFGHKGKITGPNGKPIRTTAGLLSMYTANNQDMGGTMTESEFGSWVRSLTVHGSEKTVFASPLALEVVNNYGVGKLELVQSDADTTYGLSINRYRGAGGSIINFVQHPLLEGATWGGYMIAVDFKRGAPAWRVLGGGPFGSRDTSVLTNRQENDRDGQKDEILTEGGFQFPLIKTGGVATGITG
jgi:hypothetical protein